MTWTEFAQVLTPVGVILTAVGTWLNGRQGKQNARAIEAVHHSTNGMSERNEAIARKLGVAEGKADEKANPT